ncbi:hypothetical protein KPL74_04535 [Bacillus sp. NP157]|nr:hypothetical protein KPL74_04535 [Bacillus sp. NP157]
MELDKHALATVDLYPPERNGRPIPILPGMWRADIAFDMRDGQFGFATILDRELDHGEVRQVYLTFRRPDLVMPKLRRGLRFFYCTGHAIGEGTIIDFDPDGLVVAG